jgi:hypothetical protein
MSALARPVCLAALLAALLAARLPLHLAARHAPVSNDDAIPLLMARHILRGEPSTTLWNQPYNGALEAYLMAPLVAVLPARAAFRLYEAICGALLVAGTAWLASAVGGGRNAACAAALLAAAGPPYSALMTATGPPPNFLVPLLVGLVLGVGLRSLDRPLSPAVAAVLGLVWGLAVWDSALALPSFIGGAAGLLIAGARPRPVAVLLFLAGFAVGAAPLLVARAAGAAGPSPVNAIRPPWLWPAGATDLGRAAAGLLGFDVPLVIDGPQRVPLPWVLRLALAAGLIALAGAGASMPRSAPIVGWGAAVAGAFAFSRRTGGDELRYLFGLTAPVLALAGAGFARVATRSRAAAVGLVAAVAVPWLWGDLVLARVWREPAHAAQVWQVPPLDATLAVLRRAGIRSAYASLQFAGRLTLESGGEVLASQAWNERIPGDPLRFRDEVDLDPQAAWVLSPHLSRGMPRAGGFRALMADLGGRFKEEAAGEVVVFRDFTPPYDEGRPVPREALALSTLAAEMLPPALLDRDPDMSWTAAEGLAKGQGLVVRLRPPRRVDALVLTFDPARSPQAVPWVCEADGVIVARGPFRHGLQWVNGAPRAGRQAQLTVPIGGGTAGELRLVFQGPGSPLTVSEVFVYGPDEAVRPATGAASAEAALARARSGDWPAAARLYEDALRVEPDRAAYHAARARARWRAAHRRYLDVESLDDGGPELVLAGR